MWQLTSFLRSLLSLCRCHLMRACGERAWHSRKVLLPSTPYCTISRVFLLAAGQREREGDFHGNQNTHYHEILATKISVMANQSPTAFTDYHKAARIQSLQPITMETMSCTVCSNDNEMCHCFQPSAFITKQIEAIEGEKNTWGGWRTGILPLELKPRHWRMGFPYLTSCLRLRLKGSDQCCQIRREKNHKATASHSKPFNNT